MSDLAPNRLYPLFADLRGRAVLLVGGGDVAARKCSTLLDAGARVRVCAPLLGAALADRMQAGAIEHHAGEFGEEMLDSVWLVVAATSDRQTNRRVAAAAAARRLFANVVDDAGLSTFHVPAVIDRAPLRIAVSSGGAAPMLARHLRERIEIAIDHAWGPLAALFAQLRARIRTRRPDVAARRRFYADVLAGPVLRLLRAGRMADAHAHVLARLEHSAPPTRGSVVLVGAGPGDPGLLTLSALRALNEADVILHDRLVSNDVLELARRDAERIDVGKQAGEHQVTQERIHALLLQHARRGRRVVRLKGGDPFVFGRGGEELEFLRRHGVAYEVVPGVTAALACAAYAGIPLTHRDHAQSLQLLTGHCRESSGAGEAAGSAHDPRQTLAIYMGVAQVAPLRERLLRNGHDPQTPIAIVENGTRGDQRVLVGVLDGLEALIRQQGVRSPALLIVGSVAALARELGWFGAAPVDCSPAPDARAGRTDLARAAA